VERVLLAGSEAAGFDTDLWTVKRVAVVIEQVTGSYHPGHVWCLLRAPGWSPQRPMRRAAERDEQAIGRWDTQDWPRIKQTPRSKAVGWSSPRVGRLADPTGAHDVGAAPVLARRSRWVRCPSGVRYAP
jgi:hypothetical protein